MPKLKGQPSKICELHSEPGKKYWLKRQGRNESRVDDLSDPNGQGKLVPSSDINQSTVNKAEGPETTVESVQEGKADETNTASD